VRKEALNLSKNERQALLTGVGALAGGGLGYSLGKGTGALGGALLGGSAGYLSEPLLRDKIKALLDKTETKKQNTSEKASVKPGYNPGNPGATDISPKAYAELKAESIDLAKATGKPFLGLAESGVYLRGLAKLNPALAAKFASKFPKLTTLTKVLGGVDFVRKLEEIPIAGEVVGAASRYFLPAAALYGSLSPGRGLKGFWSYLNPVSYYRELRNTYTDLYGKPLAKYLYPDVEVPNRGYLNRMSQGGSLLGDFINKRR